MSGRNLEARDGSVLVVCTGNVCRSPYIERLLRSRLAGTAISVVSAGTGAIVGSDMDPRVAQRLARAGANSADFVARQLDERIVADADLILCATRKHRSQVVRVSPTSLRRTYALADFSDISAHLVGAEIPQHAGEGSLVRTVCRAAEHARSSVQARPSEDAEIVDPFGQPDRAFERMFEQVERLLPPIAAVLTGTTLEPVAIAEEDPVD